MGYSNRQDICCDSSHQKSKCTLAGSEKKTEPEEDQLNIKMNLKRCQRLKKYKKTKMFDFNQSTCKIQFEDEHVNRCI